MTICEIRVEVDRGLVEAAEEVLLEHGDGRWSVFEDVVAGKAWIVGVFEDESGAREAWRVLAPEVPGAADATPEVRPLADADWRESYKAHFKPWRIGRLHWVPVWERPGYRLPAGDEVVWLDPGMAFGTGNHETTRLCVERLVAFDPGRRAGASVVDAGCGSGILAISAAKLGFGRVRGFDNDPEAVRIARKNAAANEVAGRVSFAVGDLVSGFGGERADLVLANIQADVLVRFAGELAGAVASGGELVLCGILAAERDAVRAAFDRLAPGAAIDSRLLGEWADLVLRPVG